jgi:hypothetical protein
MKRWRRIAIPLRKVPFYRVDDFSSRSGSSESQKARTFKKLAHDDNMKKVNPWKKGENERTSIPRGPGGMTRRIDVMPLVFSSF